MTHELNGSERTNERTTKPTDRMSAMTEVSDNNCIIIILRDVFFSRYYECTKYRKRKKERNNSIERWK